MKMKTLTKVACVVTVAAMFASCSTSNQLASSFGKRKYTKGYFFNTPGKQKGVDSYETSYAVNKTAATEATAPVVAQNAPVAPSSVATAPVAAAPKVATGKTGFFKRVSNTIALINKSMDARMAKNSVKEELPSNNGMNIQSQVTDNTDAISSEMKGGHGGSCKGWVACLLLCAFVGVLGIHRFYMGYTWQGVVQLLTAGACGIWTTIDFYRIAFKDLKPKGGDYCN